MNREISRLYVFVVVLFVLLVGATSLWTVFDAPKLRANSADRRPLLEQLQIPRGLILADDGTRLADNKHVGQRETKRYYRVYPTGSLFSHTVGYSFVSRGSSGLEHFYDSWLSGNGSDLHSFLDELGGGAKEGDDLYTTLDPKAQQVALSALAGQAGSIVALDPSTGAVKVMASMPNYDPNQVDSRFQQLNSDQSAPLFDRATQARYLPGSSFKVVTAAAALDSGKYTPDTVLNGANNQVISGVPLQNFNGENPGQVSLTDALTQSVNTVFAQIGVSLGRATMYKYMNRFGFDTTPQLDYPTSQMTASGEFLRGRLLDQNSRQVDVGRMAIGQDKLEVTPLQMAEVTAAVANHGVLMKPRLVNKIQSADGVVRATYPPTQQSTVMSSTAASELAGMMANVVKSGTGTAAALSGVQVAGKTGTAQVAGANQAWFIAFAPVNNPKVAVAVTLERTSQSLTGGEVAAPLAKQVIQTILSEHG